MLLNFNCPWDKNIWGDLYCYGYVRDLADWFVSEEPCHKLGTVYAFLQSILSADKYLYSYLIRNLLGCEAWEPVFLPYLAARIVKRLCPGCLTEYDLDEFTPELNGSLLRELYMGKACCHLEDEAFGKGVREALVREIDKKVQAMKKLVLYRR